MQQTKKENTDWSTFEFNLMFAGTQKKPLSITAFHFKVFAYASLKQQTPLIVSVNSRYKKTQEFFFCTRPYLISWKAHWD